MGFLMTGLPAIIVGLIAAIRPETYDMSKTYYKDVMCGSLKLPAEIMRDRSVKVSVKRMRDSPYNVPGFDPSLLPPWRFGVNVPSL